MRKMRLARMIQQRGRAKKERAKEVNQKKEHKRPSNRAEYRDMGKLGLAKKRDNGGSR